MVVEWRGVWRVGAWTSLVLVGGRTGPMNQSMYHLFAVIVVYHVCCTCGVFGLNSTLRIHLFSGVYPRKCVGITVTLPTG